MFCLSSLPRCLIILKSIEQLSVYCWKSLCFFKHLKKTTVNPVNPVITQRMCSTFQTKIPIEIYFINCKKKKKMLIFSKKWAALARSSEKKKKQQPQSSPEDHSSQTERQCSLEDYARCRVATKGKFGNVHSRSSDKHSNQWPALRS